MSMMGSLALIAAWLLGSLMVTVLWPPGHWRKDMTLILPLGVLVGYGATAVTFFVSSLVSARPALIAGVVEVSAIVVLLWRTRSRMHPLRPGAAAGGGETARTPPAAPPTAPQWILMFVFIQAVIIAAVVASRAYQAEPLGGWDGWAIWNMHARFMLRAGTAWPGLLEASQLSWTHPDYPPLLPATVARVWSWAGAEAPWAAALVSVSFATAMVAMMMAVASRFRGKTTGLTVGLVLLATPFLVTFAPNQHADIPLASFMLAAVSLALLASRKTDSRGWWALAGGCAGFAAWTKNEGLLFVTVVAAAAGVLLWRQHSRTAALSFFAALALPVAVLIAFKLSHSAANDLMSVPMAQRWPQLFDGSRHATIVSSLWRDLGRFGEWQLAPWIALALPFATWRQRRRLTRAEWLVPVVLALMLAGYYTVYLLTPQDLAWHLDSSLVRLLLQLWPIALLAWSLALPERNLGVATNFRSQQRKWSGALFVVASAAAAAVVANVLSTQRAANEFAVRRIGRSEVSAIIGEGWFALERHGRDEWAWSSGRAIVPLHVRGARAAGPLTMHFALRSVGSRTVTIRERDRVLWQGAVGGESVAVTLSGLILPPGTTPLEFVTDTPAVAESAAAGGRPLAFALFNLRMK